MQSGLSGYSSDETNTSGVLASGRARSLRGRSSPYFIGVAGVLRFL